MNAEMEAKYRIFTRAWRDGSLVVYAVVVDAALSCGIGPPTNFCGSAKTNRLSYRLD